MTISHRSAISADYEWIIGVVDDWWRRPVSSGLPRLFLEHFHSTSLVAEDSGKPVGFLVGFFSPSNQTEAYIHFVGVDPQMRRRSVGKELYEHFFEIARNDGRIEVKAITASINHDSIEFHRYLGFSVSPPIANYNGSGVDFVIFSRLL